MWVRSDIDTSYLDKMLLDEEGRLKVVPAATYDAIPHDDLMLWTRLHAFYGLPTTELVDYLRAHWLGTRRAIEIGSGNGALGRALGVPMTDSYIQQPGASELVDTMYTALNQPRVQYGKDVEKLEAREAVRKYRPEVVIGSWITQKISANVPPPPGGGSVHGVDEEWLLKRVETYIVVGNLTVHGQKRIMKHNPIVVREPWIKSRSMNPEYNCILIWQGERR